MNYLLKFVGTRDSIKSANKMWKYINVANKAIEYRNPRVLIFNFNSRIYLFIYLFIYVVMQSNKICRGIIKCVRCISHSRVCVTICVTMCKIKATESNKREGARNDRKGECNFEIH